MLSVASFIVMLSVVIPCVVMLSVVAERVRTFSKFEPESNTLAYSANVLSIFMSHVSGHTQAAASRPARSCQRLSPGSSGSPSGVNVIKTFLLCRCNFWKIYWAAFTNLSYNNLTIIFWVGALATYG
jgi:hypothetical protein